MSIFSPRFESWEDWCVHGVLPRLPWLTDLDGRPTAGAGAGDSSAAGGEDSPEPPSVSLKELSPSPVPPPKEEKKEDTSASDHIV